MQWLRCRERLLLTEKDWGSAVIEGKGFIARCGESQKPQVCVSRTDKILSECVLFDMGRAMSKANSSDPWEWQRLHL